MNKNGTVKWILNSMGRGKSVLVLLTALSVLNAIIGTFSALITMNIVDTALTNGNLLQNVIYYGCVLVITLVIQIAQVYLTGKYTIKLDIHYRKQILSSCMDNDYRKVQSYHSGDILNRATSDVGIVAGGVANILPDFLGILVKVVSVLVVLFILDWQIALILVVLAPVTIVASKFYGKKIKVLHKNSQSIESQNRAFLTESVQNLTVIKAFNNQNPIYDYYDKIQQRGYKVRMKINVFSIIANVLMFLSVTVLYYIALSYGAYKVSMGLITVGTLTALLQLVVQFQSPFKALSGVVNNFYKMIASSERVREFINLPKDSYCVSKNTNYDDFESIDITDLTFAYDEAPVINKLNCSISKGEFVGVSGVSGAGKSTFLKLLIGLLIPASGDIKIVTKNGLADRRALFSYVPQGNMILSGTIRENVTFFNKDISETAIYRALDLCCLRETIEELPLKLDTEIGESGLGLSEGQLQRLSIARALVMDKKILLLDEATSALDEPTERKIIENLKSNDFTVILVTHHTNIIKECDRVINI